MIIINLTKQNNWYVRNARGQYSLRHSNPLIHNKFINNPEVDMTKIK